MVRISRGAGVPPPTFLRIHYPVPLFCQPDAQGCPTVERALALRAAPLSRLFQTRCLHQRRGALFLITLLPKLDILGALSIEGRSTNLISPYTSSLRPLFLAVRGARLPSNEQRTRVQATKKRITTLCARACVVTRPWQVSLRRGGFCVNAQG